MLFKEFVLHNYGIYRGRHSVNLMPGHKQPIILFGALNGSGKTTFLDGLQLALYGKQARCAGRGNMAYQDFLRSSINRYVPPSEGAGLELEFVHHHEGRWRKIRVCRFWNVRGTNVREKLEVYRDGVLDSVLSAHWSEYVEDFIPSQISELFFFDGEKIEALAEESSASAIIRTGIHALLGLDVVDRLSADLKVLQRRRKTEQLDAEAQARIAEKYKELEAATKQRQELTQKIAEQNEVIFQREEEVIAAKERYRLEGGELAEQAALIDITLERLKMEKARQDVRLIELAAGPAPLLLVKDLVFATKAQAESEAATLRAQTLLQELEARDQQVLSVLNEAHSPADVIQSIASKLAADRIKRAEQANKPVYLNISPEAFAPYTEGFFQQLRSEIDRELEHAREIAAQIEHCERTLASMPSPESLAPLKEELEEFSHLLMQEKGQLYVHEQQRQEVIRQVERLEREYQTLLEQEAQIVFQNETNQRVLKHIDKVEDTLKQYRQAILAKNLERLSALILQSFQRITRKKNVFSRIEIGAKDYRLSLYDRHGKLIPSHQLSAGERQLLAISILWGLSQAAGRPLPAIIDTPLGRLDGQHRSKLVSNYFPTASHQVILLSTDEEINANLYSQISKSVSREYLIEFDETSLSSEIREGYFDFDEAPL